MYCYGDSGIPKEARSTYIPRRRGARPDNRHARGRHSVGQVTELHRIDTLRQTGMEEGASTVRVVAYTTDTK